MKCLQFKTHWTPLSVCLSASKPWHFHSLSLSCGISVFSPSGDATYCSLLLICVLNLFHLSSFSSGHYISLIPPFFLFSLSLSLTLFLYLCLSFHGLSLPTHLRLILLFDLYKAYGFTRLLMIPQVPPYSSFIHFLSSCPHPSIPLFSLSSTCSRL